MPRQTVSWARRRTPRVVTVSEYEGWNVKKLRERLLQADINSLADIGLINEDSIDYLISFEDSYIPESSPHWETGEPAYYAENTERWRGIVRRELSKNLRKAIRNGNEAVIKFALGFGNTEEQVAMDFVDYKKLERVMSEPALLLNIFAAPRTGKTFTAARLADFFLFLYPSAVLASNIRSWAEKHPRATYVDGLPALIEWASENPDTRKLAIGDEFSSEAAWRDIQKSGVEQGIRQFTRKMGKAPYNLSIIAIGHRPKDIAPILRNGEMAHFAFKEGDSKQEQRKNMTLYEALDGEEGADEVCSLAGIGLPSVQPDTNDQASWDWGTPEELAELGFMSLDEDDEGESEANAEDVARQEREDMALTMYENGVGSYADIGAMLSDDPDDPYSKQTVYDWVKRARDRAESSDES